MKTAQAEQRRVGIAETETFTGLGRTTIWRRCKDGSFPECHFIGERRMWFMHDLEKWAAEEMARPREARRVPRNLKLVTP